MAKHMVNLTPKPEKRIMVQGDTMSANGPILLAFRTGPHGQKGRKTRSDVLRRVLAER